MLLTEHGTKPIRKRHSRANLLRLENMCHLICGIDPVFHTDFPVECLYTKERIDEAMSSRERIMIIRLMEKLQAYPEFAKTLGIIIGLERKETFPDSKRYQNQ